MIETYVIEVHSMDAMDNINKTIRIAKRFDGLIFSGITSIILVFQTKEQQINAYKKFNKFAKCKLYDKPVRVCEPESNSIQFAKFKSRKGNDHED